MKIFFDKSPVSHVDDLISRYRPKEFQSAMRSTVPLLSLFKHGAGLLGPIMSELVGGREPTAVHFEFTVSPPLGTGKPSHTDAMLIRENRACALEAKWTEPPYVDVGAWIADGVKPNNRRAVLAGWLSLLQPFACRPLELEGFGKATYQMVHRAASACAAGHFPTLAYVQFSPLPDLTPPLTDDLRKALSHFQALLGPESRISIKLIEVRMKPTSAFDRLRVLTKRSPETADAVQKSLRTDVLFDFIDLQIHPVICNSS